MNVHTTMTFDDKYFYSTCTVGNTTVFSSGPAHFNLKQLPKELYQMIQEKKAEKFEAELKQVNAAVNNPDTDMKALRAKLSPTAQRVLNQLNAGCKDIPATDWKTLCQELERLGAITSTGAEMANPGFRPLPVGYFDEDENLIPYPAPPYYLLASYQFMPQYANERGEMQIPFLWSGDPYQYMDEWIKATQDWIDDILKIRNADGSLCYQRKDVAALEHRIDAGQDVYDLIKNLSQA